jgi:hypothetical protein
MCGVLAARSLNMSENTNKAAPSIEPLDEPQRGGSEELRRLAITSHEQTSYEWNGYRYSNVADAIAAAKRAAR